MKTIEEKLDSPKRSYLFVRAEGFYPVTLPEDCVADNAERNPGTQKVIDSLTGLVVWEPATLDRENGGGK